MDKAPLEMSGPGIPELLAQTENMSPKARAKMAGVKMALVRALAEKMMQPKKEGDE